VERIKTKSKISTVIDFYLSRLEDLLNNIGMTFVLLLMLMVVLEIFLRYVINRPLQGYVDYMEMFMVVLVFLTLPISQREDSHIRMGLIIDKLRNKTKIIVELVFLILSFLSFLIITIYSADTALYAYKIHDTSSGILFPTWPSRLAVPLGAGFLCLRFLLQIYYKFVVLFNDAAVKGKYQ
jgi:C4-dicarboxylate transporter DctQ subunit